MKDFFRHNGILLLIIAALLAIITVVASFLLGGTANPVSGAIGFITTPVREGINGVVNWMEDRYDYAYKYEQLVEQNEQLKKKVAEMEEEIRAAKSANEENVLLRDIAGVTQKRKDLDVEMATITAWGASNWESTFTISKGENAGFAVRKLVLAPGERSKSLATLGKILGFLAENQLNKSDLVVALGGGVVGDVAGFAASIYLREIALVQLPTTLLAAIDSSVGGKTAIDLPQGKNLAGTFCQPKLVICDTAALDTLPDEQFAEGVAEGIKYGLLADKALFETFANGVNRRELDEIVARCVEIKADLVGQDEHDNGARQLLNLGHTVGHAIERCSNFSIAHGKAVAMGMVVISRAAYAQGLSQENCTPPLLSALDACHLPTGCPYSAQQLAQSALADKKRRGDTITLIIPETIGRCQRHPLPVEQLQGFIAAGLGEC